uniref:Protein SPT2 homolog n=1 Tax=Parastrongyloides trichosuri TaxID=131310 RepID=A0A0N4ZR28_PARTI
MDDFFKEILQGAKISTENSNKAKEKMTIKVNNISNFNRGPRYGCMENRGNVISKYLRNQKSEKQYLCSNKKHVSSQGQNLSFLELLDLAERNKKSQTELSKAESPRKINFSTSLESKKKEIQRKKDKKLQKNEPSVLFSKRFNKNEQHIYFASSVKDKPMEKNNIENKLRKRLVERPSNEINIKNVKTFKKDKFNEYSRNHKLPSKNDFKKEFEKPAKISSSLINNLIPDGDICGRIKSSKIKQNSVFPSEKVIRSRYKNISKDSNKEIKEKIIIKKPKVMESRRKLYIPKKEPSPFYESDNSLDDFITSDDDEELDRREIEDALQSFSRSDRRKWIENERLIKEEDMISSTADIQKEERRSYRAAILEDLMEQKRGSRAL